MDDDAIRRRRRRYRRTVSSVLLVVLAIVLLVLVPLLILWRVLSRGRDMASLTEDVAYATLRTTNEAAPALHDGLRADTAQQVIRPLRRLLGGASLAIADTHGLLAWSGPGEHHGEQLPSLAADALASGEPTVAPAHRVRCDHPNCEIRWAAFAPLLVDGQVVGVLGAYSGEVSPSLERTTAELAGWVSGQLELAELGALRRQLADAQMTALRAQISPHFIFNALTAIASYVRTDPDTARELLLDFADFTRYSLREHGQYTTLAEELRSINRYLALERARFGERLQVNVRIAPEVLPVAVPFLCLQPIVENAVQHGIETESGTGHIEVVAENDVHECRVRIEDDGAGADPAHIRRILSGEVESDSLGIANVDARMRATFGDEFGIVIETAPGAGTAVTLRFPKFHPGVRVG